MRARKFIFGLLAGVIFIGCSEETTQTKVENNNENDVQDQPHSFVIEEVSWMIGNWVDTLTYIKQNGHYVEEWEMNKDSLFSVCKAIQNGDTSIVAYRSIQIIDSLPVFIEHIPNRPLVSYRLDTQFDSGIRFVNKAQSFPMEITYQRLTDDSLRVTLYGIAGQFERQGTLDFLRF